MRSSWLSFRRLNHGQVSRCDESPAIKRLNLETFARFEVHAVRQGNIFTYHMNAKEMMMWDLGAKNTKQIKTQEEQTGVNLDHYYKQNIQN